MVAGDLFGVALFFGEDAAAVFLQIEAEGASFGLPLAETRAKITIKKLYARESSKLLADRAQLIVLLIRRNQQSSSKSIIPMFSGKADSFGEALSVAIINTAVGNIGNHITAEFVETVIFVDNQLGADSGGIIFEAVATGLVLDVWMDVGIIPKKYRLNILGVQTVNTINAARCAAGMHQ